MRTTRSARKSDASSVHPSGSTSDALTASASWSSVSGHHGSSSVALAYTSAHSTVRPGGSIPGSQLRNSAMRLKGTRRSAT